ncbi:hypothetical protein ABEX78_22290 [Priestia megaterium]
MIKINLSNLDEIKLKHLNGLRESVSKKLKTEIEDAKNKNDKDLERFLQYLETKIETILIGSRSELEEIITKVEKEYYISINKMEDIKEKVTAVIGDTSKKLKIKSLIKEYVTENHLNKHLKYKYPSTIENFIVRLNALIKKWGGYREILERVFNYKNFSKEKVNGWSAYKLVTLLGVGVCPYCNRTYTTTLRKTDENGKMTRPELDHYYPKFRYQYLGISFYNLIPSCSVCNSSLKNTVDFYRNEAIHPYEEEFLNVATFVTDFDYSNEDSYKYLLGYSKDFKIGFEIKTDDLELKKRIERSIETFDLERMYNTHQDIVNDLIRNSRIYTKERIEEINKSFPDMFGSEDEILESLFLNYMSPENIGKRPLSKLTQDIYNELRLKDNINKSHIK